jgi:predicted transcriptional regulator
MKTVTFEVRSPDEGMKEFVQTWRSGKAQRSARIGFATPELLWKVLSAKRWELLKALCGAGPVSIRDVEAVHSDVTALLSAGLLNRTETGNIEVPLRGHKS